MPACTLQREVDGSTALYRIAGRFEGSCARELEERLRREPLREVVIDFSQVTAFMDSGVAVIAAPLCDPSHHVRLRGLRQHQERLFRYFGVEPADVPLALPAAAPEPAQEVA